MSSWVNINGSVLQGTKLSALLFLVMVNDFQTNHPMIKYVDDDSVTEKVKYPKSNTDGSISTLGTHHKYWWIYFNPGFPPQILMDLFPPWVATTNTDGSIPTQGCHHKYRTSRWCWSMSSMVNQKLNGPQHHENFWDAYHLLTEPTYITSNCHQWWVDIQSWHSQATRC